ncbi:hypothetical protein F5882DRAFT_441729 [Hyaloscypha sp. PMI_1271]|nr:hypothetical protein F5882DRAFT_441729 [Hyaloscypha sp. PMI_1271]
MSDQIELDELAGASSSCSSRLLALFRARPSARTGIPRQPLPMSLCEECDKASRNGSVSGVLHSNLDKILSCASECAFCAYLCDLVGREKLSQAQREIISSGHSQISLSRDERVELNQKLRFWWSHHHRNTFGRDTTFVTKELTVCGKTCGVAQLSAPKHERKDADYLGMDPRLQREPPQCVAPASSTSSARPARFVDIRGLRSGGAVKLIRFADIPQGDVTSISYVTLSHRWGGVVPLRTLKANLRDHLKKIPKSSIPRTFSNAIILAQALGIGFLWVDSLCIVQDDPSDWETEASKMHTILTDASAGHHTVRELFFTLQHVTQKTALAFK